MTLLPHRIPPSSENPYGRFPRTGNSDLLFRKSARSNPSGDRLYAVRYTPRSQGDHRSIRPYHAIGASAARLVTGFVVVVSRRGHSKSDASSTATLPHGLRTRAASARRIRLPLPTSESPANLCRTSCHRIRPDRKLHKDQPARSTDRQGRSSSPSKVRPGAAAAATEGKQQQHPNSPRSASPSAPKRPSVDPPASIGREGPGRRRRRDAVAGKSANSYTKTHRPRLAKPFRPLRTPIARRSSRTKRVRDRFRLSVSSPLAAVPEKPLSAVAAAPPTTPDSENPS